ncbi:large ribosomal subunit protein mL51 [Neoarius graeffei]|uniref:large ribosomal subunit protein mL51 n=1 Tax=Neoarius graeffei TaxID=443677 RepID=UPI00298C2D4C|nr:large ribosomal subunit protein mL51 [Neoarius graeffei]
MSVLGIVLNTGVSLWRNSLQLCATHLHTGACLRMRMHAIPPLKQVDRWTEKRSMFGVYDNIGILGDFKAHPKELIRGPVWLQGFRGNEYQRLMRKKRMVGDRMMTEDKHLLEKRLRFLYRRFNRYGKHR